MTDDPYLRPSGRSPGCALAVREEQCAFYSGIGAAGALVQRWPGRPVDANLVGYSQAAERLAVLVTAAVRASDDDAGGRLNPILQAAETLLGMAEGVTVR